MKIHRYNNGFTLLEVIVSISIFSIIAIALIDAFSNGIISIYTSGNKTRAVEKTQSLIDDVWEASEHGTIKASTLDSDIKNLLGSDNYCPDINELYLSEGKDMKFNYITNEYIKDKYYVKITIVVFYQNKSRNVSLTSIIPVGGM